MLIGRGDDYGLDTYSGLYHRDSGPGTPFKTPLRLTDAERVTLAEIAHRLGRKALEDVANAAKPDTIIGWYRRLVARKFDGSKSRRYPIKRLAIFYSAMASRLRRSVNLQ